MAQSPLESFIERELRLEHALTAAVKNPVLLYKNEAQNFTISWWAITEPFVMEAQTFYHDFDQFLYFIGGDLGNMLDLGGEVEFTMGEDMDRLEKLVITRATVIHVPKGMLHSPLVFKKINDPRKPILFQDMSMTTRYRKFFPGSNIPYDQHNQIITDE
ncbi:MAG: hypothetical protein GX044_08875 [Firmicutes bacterium]|jgi:hypothetical protein|nr:hypothetical protein [Bacillota bacterium]